MEELAERFGEDTHWLLLVTEVLVSICELMIRLEYYFLAESAHGSVTTPDLQRFRGESGIGVISVRGPSLKMIVHDGFIARFLRSRSCQLCVSSRADNHQHNDRTKLRDAVSGCISGASVALGSCWIGPVNDRPSH
jgi:hypothetical protein